MSRTRTGKTAHVLSTRVATGLALCLGLITFGVTGAASAQTPGEACFFSAPYGAIPSGGLVGHIGWGFRGGTGDNWIFGATEGIAGLSGILIKPGGDTHTWQQQGSFAQMLNAFATGAHQFGNGPGYYLQYRCGNVPDSNPTAAINAAAAAAESGYNLAKDNCLDKAAAILIAYQTPNLVAPGYFELPNLYFDTQLPPEFEPVRYFTSLTIAVGLIDPVSHQYVNPGTPMHTQRPIRIRVVGPLGISLYDSGYSTMATVTPGKDRYVATIPLPSPSPNDPLLQSWSTGSSPTYYTVEVSLQYTLPTQVTIPITQGIDNVIQPDVPLTVGDINGDGHVDIADYNLLIDCFSDLSPPIGPCPPSQQTAADLDDDGKVDGTDYNEMLRIFKSQEES